MQVAGRLVTVGEKGEGKTEWTVTGYVHTEGYDLLLDCTANGAAQKLFKKELGDPDAPSPPPLCQAPRPIPS